jgi:hypothetical protein
LVSEEDVALGRAAALLRGAVGALVIQYAILEHWIDGMVACLFMRVDGARSIRQRYPFNAADEADFLARCFADLPALAGFKNEALDLLAKIRPLAELRHNVVHGRIWDMDLNSLEIQFSRVFKDGEGNPIRRTLTITGPELTKAGHQIHELNPAAMKLCHRLVDQFGTEDDKKKPPGS